MYKVWKDKIQNEGGYEKFSRGYERFGFTVSKTGITYREWAPNAKEAFLFGDFSTFLSLDDQFLYSIFFFVAKNPSPTPPNMPSHPCVCVVNEK